MTGPQELLFAYYRRIDAENRELKERVSELERRLCYVERQLTRNRRLRRLWTIRCHKARDNRDMWRTRALDAHGTKRRIRAVA